MIDYSLSLDYRLSPGWLSPFVDGLSEGKIMARQCSACCRTSVPPVRSCVCGCGDGQWTALSGHARIIKRSSGSDGDFALVRFDGADTLSVVSLESLPSDATHGVIKTLDTDLPTLILVSAPSGTTI